MLWGMILIANFNSLRDSFHAGNRRVVEWMILNTNLWSLTKVYFTGWIDASKSSCSSGVNAAISSTQSSRSSSSIPPSLLSFSCSMVSSSSSMSPAKPRSDCSSLSRSEASLSVQWRSSCLRSDLVMRLRIWLKHRVWLTAEKVVSKLSIFLTIVSLLEVLSQVTDSILCSILKSWSMAANATAKFRPLYDFSNISTTQVIPSAFLPSELQQCQEWALLAILGPPSVPLSQHMHNG